MTDAETIGRYMSVKKYKEVASLLINVLKDKESIDIQQAFSNAINFSRLCKGAIEGVFTWASRIALEEGKLLVVYPETDLDISVLNWYNQDNPTITITGIRLKLADLSNYDSPAEM